tara:strand:+ start:833 stop:1393 length:561 start_codon:yes stop_codon:yes gene_type:complete
LNTNSLDLNASIEWVRSGKILAHPTESIWGLGCDAFNEDAVENLINLKKRNNKKNFILLASSVEFIEKYVHDLSKDDKDFLNKYWPGPYTFLFNYSKNLPKHLQNRTGKIAIRVSDHLPIKQLFRGLDNFFVSTSANLSGAKNINDPNEVLNFFDYKDLAYYDADLGSLNKPSTIVDLESKEIIRD